MNKENNQENSMDSGSRLNIKTAFPKYGDPHVKHTTVVRPSYH